MDASQSTNLQIPENGGQELEKGFMSSKYFIGESNNVEETTVLVIDLNYPELPEQKGDQARFRRTGTPVFIPRAAQKLASLNFPERGLRLDPMPDSPTPLYASAHPERLQKFRPGGSRYIISPSSSKCAWTHELDHDVESVFWLIFYWAMSSQPKNHPNDFVNPGYWALLNGSADARQSLIKALVDRDDIAEGAVHSAFEPLLGLIGPLAAVLRLDRHWLKETDIENDTEYIVEAFQRLILQFAIKYRDEPFVKIGIERKARQVGEVADAIDN
ncbi:hypothetical protein FRB90_005265 [Tulasnella sp. 427]|nr:hypothetical protein FRB90_005265 [Tulasnella sp. 427]